MGDLSKGKRLSAVLRKKEQKLQEALKTYGRVMVAYSGGVDSTLLVYESVAALGADQVIAATAVSEVFPPEETNRARALCRRFKVKHRLLAIAPLKDEAFCKNDKERCYYCKRNFLGRLRGLAETMKIPFVLEASQIDDLKDYRPGARAVKAEGILSPLKEAGLNKAAVRGLSRFHGLPTADLPAAACLASRVPYGTRITKPLLLKIAQAEEAVRRLGFREFRLRHHQEVARLEFAPEEMDRAYRYRRALRERVKILGWTYVTIDLEGYRTGSLNEVLRGRAVGRPRR